MTLRAEANVTPAGRERAGDGKANILLVDDRRENLVALEAILEPLGQNLVSVTSGDAALRELLHTDFALILLDVQMPELDGFETAAYIKQREKTRSVPIIFLTAISKDEQHVFHGYSVGAVDYLFKPFNPDVLRSKVSVFIDLHRKNEELRRQEELLREQELAALARSSEERYRELADAMPQIVWTSRPDGSVEYFNRQWFELTGMTLEQTQGWGWQPVLHPDDLGQTLARWRQSLATGEVYENETRFRRASDGRYRWHLVRGVPTRDASGAITRWVGTCTDIDDRKRVQERERFLIQAGDVLSRSLDYRATLASVAQLAVPDVADWCAVDVLEDGRTHRLAVAHVDPTKVAFVEELQRRYPPHREQQIGPRHVVDTGEPELVPEIRDELLESVAVDDIHLELLRELGLRSYMSVPLVARGRTLGAISLVSAESGRVFGAADLELAQELARRAATAVDNAQLHHAAEERAQAARVLASVADGVFLLDEQGVIRLWNEAAAAITGLPPEDVIGRRAVEAIPGWQAVAERLPLAQAPGPVGGGHGIPLEIGGRELWLAFSGVALDEGVVYAFRDLTEQHAVEAMKRDFVATVSHELRTPLAAIYGAAVTLRRRDLELDAEMRDRLLDVVADEADRLAHIVEDVLLASRLDSGAVSVAIEHCDARELAESVVDAARTHLPDNVSVEVDVADDLPPVVADAAQLRQVLGNLIENAVKYSPDGGRVELALQPTEQNVRFVVRDEGLGIPVGEQRRIFEKFYRLDPNMTRGIGGTGLGLYICRELVRRVDGRIWVESEEGKGSSFFVELPAATRGDNGRARAGGSKQAPAKT
ncbi:MAG: PAS domain S-box protein [Actinomycetota bacterium]|nr:PAS domain S-box protein [Actinomycetota bacterium]